jgi:hypothetical protein
MLKTSKVLKKAHIPYISACHLQIDADSDPAYHFVADPDPAHHFDADQVFYLQFDADPCVPDPQHRYEQQPKSVWHEYGTGTRYRHLLSTKRGVATSRNKGSIVCPPLTVIEIYALLFELVVNFEMHSYTQLVEGV